MKYLHAENLYESQEEALVREEVLGMLEQLVKTWIKQVRFESTRRGKTLQVA
jgi:poly(A) polymerase